MMPYTYGISTIGMAFLQQFWRDSLDSRFKKPDKLTIIKIAHRNKQEKQNVAESFFRELV